MVLREMGTVETNAAGMKRDIAGFVADGCTPLVRDSCTKPIAT